MEEISIPRFELAEIHNALRLASLRLKCDEKKGELETAMDRQIKKAMTFAKNRLRNKN